MLFAYTFAQSIGTPPLPFNLTNFIKEYHDSFYSITLSWAATQFRVDYYMVTITSHAVMLQNELILAHMYNTSNNFQTPDLSVVISNLPYNENITASLSAHSCIGSSLPENITFNIGKFINYLALGLLYSKNRLSLYLT